jgi:hypothetical protein
VTLGAEEITVQYSFSIAPSTELMAYQMGWFSQLEIENLILNCSLIGEASSTEHPCSVGPRNVEPCDMPLQGLQGAAALHGIRPL